MAQTSSASPSGGASHKWVYLFEEGNADRNLLYEAVARPIEQAR